jgi:hypothetical protein
MTARHRHVVIWPQHARADLVHGVEFLLGFPETEAGGRHANELGRNA